MASYGYKFNGFVGDGHPASTMTNTVTDALGQVGVNVKSTVLADEDHGDYVVAYERATDAQRIQAGAIVGRHDLVEIELN